MDFAALGMGMELSAKSICILVNILELADPSAAGITNTIDPLDLLRTTYYVQLLWSATKKISRRSDKEPICADGLRSSHMCDYEYGSASTRSGGSSKVLP